MIDIISGMIKQFPALGSPDERLRPLADRCGDAASEDGVGPGHAHAGPRVPAIISGEETARAIIDDNHSTAVMEKLIRRHRLHSRLADWTGSSPALNLVAGELVTLGLRCGIIKFNKLEMAV